MYYFSQDPPPGRFTVNRRSEAAYIANRTGVYIDAIFEFLWDLLIPFFLSRKVLMWGYVGLSYIQLMLTKINVYLILNPYIYLYEYYYITIYIITYITCCIYQLSNLSRYPQ